MARQIPIDSSDEIPDPTFPTEQQIRAESAMFAQQGEECETCKHMCDCAGCPVHSPMGSADPDDGEFAAFGMHIESIPV